MNSITFREFHAAYMQVCRMYGGAKAKGIPHTSVLNHFAGKTIMQRKLDIKNVFSSLKEHRCAMPGGANSNLFGMAKSRGSPTIYYFEHDFELVLLLQGIQYV